jgi:8-oxo-dGTP diphosphatase
MNERTTRQAETVAERPPRRKESETYVKLAVSVVVRREDDRFLMIERARGRFAQGYWTPITGRLEPGESLAEAARREVREETGLQVEVGPELGRSLTEAPPGLEDPGFELVWFEARVVGPLVLSLEPSEVAEARWTTLEEALLLEPMFPGTRRSLSEWAGR